MFRVSLTLMTLMLAHPVLGDDNPFSSLNPAWQQEIDRVAAEVADAKGPCARAFSRDLLHISRTLAERTWDELEDAGLDPEKPPSPEDLARDHPEVKKSIDYWTAIATKGLEKMAENADECRAAGGS